MKPARFEYWDPTSVEQVLGFLEEHGDDSKVLAGGQSLMPLLNMRLARPDCVLDINRVASLGGIECDHLGSRIGALARHDDVMQSAELAERCPLLVQAMPYIGHTAIRYRGTVGGSLAHADPAAELPAVATALDAEFVIRGPRGTRTVPAREFFHGFLTTSVEPDELLVEIRFEARPPTAVSAVLELARRRGDFALVGVAGETTVEDGSVTAARLCAFGVDGVPLRLVEVEALLEGEQPSAELFDEAGALASRSVSPTSDMHASADYRRAMTAVLTRRLLAQTTATRDKEANGG
jgi:carbon-monoxide dehydrogenase medium subunit